MKINRDRLRQWVNFVAILSAFGINIWANIAPWRRKHRVRVMRGSERL